METLSDADRQMLDRAQKQAQERAGMAHKRRLPTSEQLRALLEVWQEIEDAQQAAEDTGRPANREIGGGELLVTVWPTRYRTIGPDGLDEPGDFQPEPQETS